MRNVSVLTMHWPWLGWFGSSLSHWALDLSLLQRAPWSSMVYGLRIVCSIDRRKDGRLVVVGSGWHWIWGGGGVAWIIGSRRRGE